MKLYQLWLVNIAVLTLLKFYYVPRLQRSIEYHRDLTVIRKAILMAFVSWIASIVLIAGISGGIVLATTLWVQIGSGATAEQVGKLISSVQQWRSRIGGFGPVWGTAILVMNIVALGIYAARRGKIRMLKAFELARQAALERLKQEAESGRWEDLAPTSEMNKVAGRIRELMDLINELPTEGGSETEAIKTRQHLTQEIESQKELYARLDIGRRLDPRLSPEDAKPPEPSKWWEKVQTFFISQGLWKALKGPSRAFYIANLFLLIPALLGIYSQPAAPVFENRIVRLTDLQVELTQKEAREAWEQATQMPTPEQANPTSSPANTKIHITAADQQLLKLAAREFEHALARSELFQDLAQSIKPGNDRAIRAARARDRVLQVAAEQAPGSVTEIPTGARAESGSIRAQWELVEHFSGTDPVTEPGQQIYRDLEGCAERTAGFVENLKHSMAAFPNFTGSAGGQSGLVDLGRSFQIPVYDGDLAVSTIQQTVNILFGDHLGEFGKALDGLDPQVGLAMQKAVDDRRQFYTAEIIRSNGKKASEAIETVAHSNRIDISYLNLNSFHSFGVQHPIVADGGDGLVASLNEHPPAIDPKIEAHVNLGKAQEQIREFLPKINPSWSPEYTAEVLREGTEAIADFSTHFPASVQTAMETTPFNAIKTVITETGGEGDARAWEGIGRALTQVAEGLAQNARSFAGLRGFSRVGGVLIGNKPVDATGQPVKLEDALHYADVRWEINRENIRFILLDSNGHESVSRTWRTSIAGQALAYAADGRPLAATMVRAQPLLELKILIHAALIDTGLGRRITDLDRFVDEFTGDENRNPEVAKAREDARRTVCAQDALYSYSWAERAKGILSALRNHEGLIAYIANRERVEESAIRGFLDATEKRADTLIQYSERANKGFGTEPLAARGFADGVTVLNDVAQSPLRVKKEFYEPSLVEAMAQAFREANSLPEFGKVIHDRFASHDPDLQGLVTRPPEFTVWSGVREKPFQLTEKDFFITEKDSPPEALDFMLQVAFTSAPNVDDKNYADTQPWEFPALHDKIYQTVTASINAAPEKKAIYDAATEFALLQRFFRLGFDGFLGSEFPVEKFASLAADIRTAAAPASSRTLRWNARPGLLQVTTLRDLSSNEQQFTRFQDAIVRKAALEPLIQALKDFESAIDSIYDYSSTAGWQSKWSEFSQWRKRWLDQWETKVNSLQSSAAQLGSDEIDYLRKQTAAMRLRESLGVDVDDEQMLRQRAEKNPPPLDRFDLGSSL